jgi:hypothetical protein
MDIAIYTTQNGTKQFIPYRIRNYILPERN